MALEVDWTPNGIIESNTCPDVLRCEGFYPEGEDLETCKKSRTDWQTIGKYDEIYLALSEFKPTAQFSENEERNKEVIKQYVVVLFDLTHIYIYNNTYYFTHNYSYGNVCLQTSNRVQVQGSGNLRQQQSSHVLASCREARIL